MIRLLSFAFGLMLVAASTLKAQDTLLARLAGEENPYEVIKQFYKNATPVSYKEIENKVFEGRCFTPSGEHLNRDQNFSFLVAHTFPSKLNQGPAFDPYQSKIGILESIRPDAYYDTYKDRLMYGKEGFLKAFVSDSENFEPSLFPDAPAKSSFLGGAYTFSVGRHQQYLVVELINPKETRCRAELGWGSFCNGDKLPAGTAFYCYFFNELKD